MKKQIIFVMVLNLFSSSIIAMEEQPKPKDTKSIQKPASEPTKDQPPKQKLTRKQQLMNSFFVSE